MMDKSFKTLLTYIFCSIPLLTAQNVQALPSLDDGHNKVGMRMIGHELLLKTGDDTSRVLPIEREENRYKIQFSSPLAFDPTELVDVVSNVVEKTHMAKGYLVEVASCASGEIVYSYKMGLSSASDLIPCRGRSLPKECYTLYMTILSNEVIQPPDLASEMSLFDSSESPTNRSLTALSLFVLVLLGGFSFYFHQRKNKLVLDPDLISIGDYQFNKRTMTLSHNDESIELTSKESDLLLLLYNSSNKTLERENILNVVWGDDGDYTGRTLDVFISKLRKKLIADNRLKIVNIRGVGYRFVVNQ